MIKCIMCGEKEAKKRIWNPNYDEDGFWDVCYDCEEFIQEGQKKAIEEIIKHYKTQTKHKPSKEDKNAKIKKEF